LGSTEAQNRLNYIFQRFINAIATQDHPLVVFLTQLLSESLHTPRSSCLPFFQLIHAKTGGNAFFTHQLLHTLEEEGLLWFDNNGRSWQWGVTELKKLNLFLVRKHSEKHPGIPNHLNRISLKSANMEGMV